MTTPASKPPITPERLTKPLRHEPVVDDQPWFDTELNLPQSPAHMIMVQDLIGILRTLAAELDFPFLSDNSVWFIQPSDNQQTVSFPDLVLLGPEVEVERAAAEDALFVAEVVTTTERRKEVKDTTFARAKSEYNRVPEFALFFPEIDDSRSMAYHYLREGCYQEVAASPGTVIESESIPGLAFRVLPREAWSPGRKIEVLYQGEVRPPIDGERKRAEQERKRAEQERKRAEQERKRAEQERKRAEQERNKAEQERKKAEQERKKAKQERNRAEREQEKAEQERKRAEQERKRAEQEQKKAEQERKKAEQERNKAEQEQERANQAVERAGLLSARLKELGVDPEGI